MPEQRPEQMRTETLQAEFEEALQIAREAQEDPETSDWFVEHLRDGMEAAWAIGYNDAHKGRFVYEVGVLLGNGAVSNKRFEATDHEENDGFMIFNLAVAGEEPHEGQAVEVFRARLDHVAWIGRTSSLDRV